MYDRNKGVQGIIDDFEYEVSRYDSDEYPHNAKFNIKTGKITHKLKGSIFNFEGDWCHLSKIVFPIFSKDGEYMGWVGQGRFYPVQET